MNFITDSKENNFNENTTDINFDDMALNAKKDADTTIEMNEIEFDDLLTIRDTEDLIFLNDKGEEIDLSQNLEWNHDYEEAFLDTSLISNESKEDVSINKPDLLNSLFIDEDPFII